MAQGKFTDRTDEERIMNNGLNAKIIKYKNYKDIDVQFEDGYIAYNKSYINFKNGEIKNPYAITVMGIGCIGETITVDKDNVPLRSYRIWKLVMRRCYDEDIQEKQPTYKGCSMCKEWLCYANFKKWYDNHYYEIEGENIQLDKDILSKGNKIYSPDTCIFVPQKINLLFVKNNINRGDLPIGVCRYKKQENRYGARVHRFEGEYKSLGVFNTPEEAFYVYKEAKEKEIKRVADLYKDKIPQKLYEAMYSYEVEITD